MQGLRSLQGLRFVSVAVRKPGYLWLLAYSHGINQGSPLRRFIRPVKALLTFLFGQMAVL